MGKRILFVDDNPDQVKYLRRYLQLQEYEVDGVDDIEKLFARLEKPGHGIDLVVLDVMMPTKNRYDSDKAQGGMLTGVLVGEEIKRDHPEVKVIYYTLLRRDDLLRRDESIPFFTKSDDFTTIENKIKELLGAEKKEGAAS